MLGTILMYFFFVCWVGVLTFTKSPEAVPIGLLRMGFYQSEHLASSSTKQTLIQGCGRSIDGLLFKMKDSNCFNFRLKFTSIFFTLSSNVCSDGLGYLPSKYSIQWVYLLGYLIGGVSVSAFLKINNFTMNLEFDWRYMCVHILTKQGETMWYMMNCASIWMYLVTRL